MQLRHLQIAALAGAALLLPAPYVDAQQPLRRDPPPQQPPAQTEQARPPGAPAPAQPNASFPLSALPVGPPPGSGPSLQELLDGLPTVSLQALLDQVGTSSGRQFLIDTRVTQEVYLGGVEQAAVTYPVLLSVLRANGLAAVEIDGVTNIVPMADVRMYPVPIVQNDDRDIAGDEWVTRVIQVRTVESAQFVPILRPLVPQPGHLAAMTPQGLIIVDRYANVRRITEVVRMLDR